VVVLLNVLAAGTVELSDHRLPLGFVSRRSGGLMLSPLASSEALLNVGDVRTRIKHAGAGELAPSVFFFRYEFVTRLSRQRAGVRGMAAAPRDRPCPCQP
jgi:hypothetical protein